MFDHKPFLKTVPPLPGVYVMYDEKDNVIYVGKARRLSLRLRSYFSGKKTDPKLIALTTKIRRIELMVTHSEQEALLLENNLIKQWRPRYNVIFRDDKSYPYIYISNGSFPRMDYYRGLRHNDGHFFGPYPSGYAVSESLKSLQKIFRLRQCSDQFFAHRTRPCLQYQIKRCSAPCVAYITSERYQQDVRDAMDFLQGKKTDILKGLIARMQQAAQDQNYEAAAQYRDALNQLRQIQTEQYVMHAQGHLDVIAVGRLSELACIQLLAFRNGQLLGSKAFFPSLSAISSLEEILRAFLLQHYLAEGLNKQIPPRLVINLPLTDRAAIMGLLKEHCEHKVQIIQQPKGVLHGFLKIAITNLEQNLHAQLKTQVQVSQRLEALAQLLGFSDPPTHLECFDVSHTQGEETVASCVMFVNGEPQKARYRRFNIHHVTPGDDYAAIHQAVLRHYTRAQLSARPLPQVVFIDGGKGQLSEAWRALEELQLTHLCVVAVAKGPARRPGEEVLWLANAQTPAAPTFLQLPAHSPALHLIQQIRDEAHRFAITAHRKKQTTKRVTSVLQQIPGIGKTRRRALLHYFGGIQELKNASCDEIAKVTGISAKLAAQIYRTLHQN